MLLLPLIYYYANVKIIVIDDGKSDTEMLFCVHNKNRYSYCIEIY